VSYYTVAIKWPDGYGGHERFNTLADAEAAALRDAKRGYGRKDNPIHIIEHRESKVVRVIDDSPTPAPHKGEVKK